MLQPGRNEAVTGGEYRYGFNGMEKDDELKGSGNSLDFGARIYDSRIARFNSMDRFANKFAYQSPYLFAGNTPIMGIDVNGDSLYIIGYAYGVGIQADDEMFAAAALTRASNIMNSENFDPTRDKVVLLQVNSLRDLKKQVESVVREYSGTYGETVEFNLYSHAGQDGPVGTLPAGELDLSCETVNQSELGQMTMDGWGDINFNFGCSGNERAGFYGCSTGVSTDDKKSFTGRVSNLNNFKNVLVIGQTGSSFPSHYTDKRGITSYHNETGDFIKLNPDGSFAEFTEIYMVGGFNGKELRLQQYI